MEQTQVSGYSFSTELSWKGRVRHFRHTSVTQKTPPQTTSATSTKRTCNQVPPDQAQGKDALAFLCKDFHSGSNSAILT